jgi:uncharacterized protein YlbG (UPF0298 family)
MVSLSLPLSHGQQKICRFGSKVLVSRKHRYQQMIVLMKSIQIKGEW